MRIGILGGTFDPIHRGHLRVAQAAAAAGVDLVALMPVRRPPHKDRDDIAGAYHRFAMAALAAAGERKVTVSTFEVTREAPSYTIDTVRHFVGAGHQVCLIMGSDSLSEIESWRDCRTLIEMAGVIVYPRRPLVPGVLEAKLPDWLRERWAPEGPPPPAGSMSWLREETEEVSSTAVRERIRRGQPVTGLVPASVEEYIIKQRLYTDSVEGLTD